MKALRESVAVLGLGAVLAGLSACQRQRAVPAAPLSPALAQEPAPQQPKAAPAAPAQADQPAASPFAGDRGAKLVSGLLRPSEAAFDARARTPLRLPSLTGLEDPQLPLPALPAGSPRPAERAASQGLRPGPLPESLPLASHRARPDAPRPVEFSGTVTVRFPKVDLNAPPPLPILATPRPDRAPLTDLAPGLSAAAVLAEPIPLRTTPAPFVRLNLPDPFEHANAVRLPGPVAEQPTPPITVPRTPTK
jgi:hypothetical protein